LLRDKREEERNSTDKKCIGVFPQALEMLKKNQHKLELVIAASILNQDMFANKPNSFMTDKIMPLSQAIEGYDIFNSMKVQKVIFEPDH
jgi:hypothetical protein